MRTEASVAYLDAFPQRIGGQKPLFETISPREYKEREGVVPSIPLASVLHDEYVKQRNIEKAEGRYTPGTLLPILLDQGSLRQLFTDMERKVPAGSPIDWYNPTQPFNDSGDEVMAVRLEPRESELSCVGFFKKNPRNGQYLFDNTRPILDMAQDPSITFDNKGNPILNVVRIHPSRYGNTTDFHTEQFRGPDVRHMETVQTMPGKDNRPVQLKDGEVSLVRGWSRPQGEVGGSGKLAFRDYPNWDEYNKDKRPLTEADFLITNFQDENHGGPNFPQPDGQVYGHIAQKDHDRNGKIIALRYYTTWMLTDVRTGQLLYQQDSVTGNLKPLIKVVADRADFPTSKEIPDKDTRNPEKIHDVIFTSGIKKMPNGKVKITAGISDTRIGTKLIDDPIRDVDMSHLALVA